MKKESMIFRFMLLFVIAHAVFAPAFAFAQCETPASADPAMQTLATTDTDIINNFISQENNFIQDLTETATYEMTDRLTEFNDNILTWLDGWSPKFVQALKDMTMQLSAVQVDQTKTIGGLMDAQLANEGTNKVAGKQGEAVSRYAPSEMSCQADTAGVAQTKSYQISRALSRGFALDDNKRRGNATGSVSATGQGAEINSAFQEYVAYFCDNTKGDQGCTAPGLLPGQEKDIPALLWRDKQTIDLSNSNPDNIRLVQAALRYLIYPLASDPIPPGAVESANGHQEILVRRSEEARTNVVYSAIGQMVGERVGGSGVDTKLQRLAAGIPTTSSSTSASYSELRGAMAGDRFLTPAYITQMVGNPAQSVREQGTINAIRLQMLNDIYRRSEEMLLLTAADYSRDLDKQIPGSAVSSAPLK